MKQENIDTPSLRLVPKPARDQGGNRRNTHSLRQELSKNHCMLGNLTTILEFGKKMLNIY
jgi:hypothetical protein